MAGGWRGGLTGIEGVWRNEECSLKGAKGTEKSADVEL